MGTAATEGGAGGKFRKKPFRRSAATPYDRPPNTLRAATGHGGWISKLVDPASRLITTGAHRLFASVFRKRLPAPPPPPPPPQESNHAQRSNLQDAVPACMKDSPGAHAACTVEDCYLSNSSGDSSIAELEQILKQRAFTRAQIDRLTELLCARTLHVPSGNAEKRSESDISEAIAGQDRSANVPIIDNGVENERFLGVTSTPVISTKDLQEDVVSPAELAKTYMGRRPSKVSSSMLGFRSQIFKEEAALAGGPSNPSFPSKLSIRSPAPRSSLQTGHLDNGFTTPRSFSRSTIYRMARTPYSRADPMSAHRGAISAVGGYGRPSSSSQSTWEQNGCSEPRHVGLKRRSSVLDDDIGSVGPIRRIRQKSNLILEKRSSSSVSAAAHSLRETVGSGAVQFALPPAPGALRQDVSDHENSKTLTDNGDNRIPVASFTSVPSQSSKTAARILQHLNHLVDTSPLKEKSPELKLAAARKTLPGKLTTDMLHGQALKSLESVDTSKCLQIVEDNTKLDSSNNGGLRDGHNSVPLKQKKAEENGATKIVTPCKRVVPVAASIVDSVPARASDPGFSTAVVDSYQKKRAFQMSAPEDHLDIDDDDYANEAASTVVTEGNGKLDTNMGSKASAAEAVRLEGVSASSEAKILSISVVDKKYDDLKTSDASVITEKNTSFTPASPTTSSVTVHSLVSQSTSTINPVATSKEPSAALPFSFGSGIVNNIPAKVFSSPSAGESPKSMFAAASNLKPESSNSFSSVAAEPPQREPDLHKGDGKSADKGDELIGKGNNATPFVLLPSTTPSSAASLSISSPASSFSFGISSNKSSTNNGSHSSSSIFSSSAPALVAGSLNNQTTSSSLSAASISSAMTTISGASISSATTTILTATSTTAAPGIGASGSSIVSTSAAPLFSSPSPSVFKFGSSAPVPLTSGVEAAGEEAKKTEEKSFGNQTASSFGSSSAGSSGIFGFSTTANDNKPQVSAPFSSSMLGSTSFASGSSAFGSSSSALFSSDNGSTSGTTSSTFGSKTPIFGSASNLTSPSTGFAFGSSSASASLKSVPTPFGPSTAASSGSMFSFTSAAAAAPSQPVFGNPNSSVFAFSSVVNGNNDQMNMEDSMAEDNAQAATPAVPVFGQPLVTPPAFAFGSTSPSGSLPTFQFSGQQNSTTSNPSPFQNPAAPTNPNPFQNQPASANPNPFQNQPAPNLNPFQAHSTPNPNLFQNQTSTPNPNPFQSSSSLDFSAGGSFSLGSGGTSKSNRKMIKVKRRK